MKKSKQKVFKIIMLVAAIAIIIATLVYLFPIMKDLSTTEGQVRFKEKVNESGLFGFFALFCLQVAQIFLFIIHGEPIEILAGMCYGSIWGTVFIMFTSFVISAIIFFLVKKFGRRFVYSFCDKRKVFKMRKNKLLQNPKKVEMIMFILFLIHGTPKDLLVYIAGLLPINPIRFLLISTFARFPSVISSTIAGANIAVGNLKVSIISYVVVFIIVGIVIFIANKFDKDKMIKQAIKTVK